MLTLRIVDLRLYRQKKSGQAKTSDWQCIATDCNSWEEVIKQFSQSTDEQDKDLHSYLSNHIYPAIKHHLQVSFCSRFYFK